MGNLKLVYSFFLFLINISCSSSLKSIHRCSDEQRDALLLLKQNISTTNGEYEDKKCQDSGGFRHHLVRMNWNRNIDCCNWDGVGCNKSTADVIRLNLRCGKLKGVVELGTLLSSLPDLEVLDLSFNHLSVKTSNATYNDNTNLRVLRLASCRITIFPKLLRSMKNLEVLDLSGNGIGGHIPHWAGEIGGNKLFYLDLSYNSITGLSQFQWDELQYLYLQSNLIQGPFPPLICNMNHLKRLDISDNRFTGVISECLGNISSSVVSLNVRSNMFQGPFPPSICNMSNLLYLHMSNNNFSGIIPPCFGNITSYLQIIHLGNNNFYGTIPNVYGDCGLSEGLFLQGNQLEGEVPSSLIKCQSLKALDLGNNRLNSTFPRWLGDLRQLQILILGSNHFHGTIETSSTIGFPFCRVEIFDISNNEFIGRLPEKYFENFNAIRDVEKGLKTEYVNISGLSYSIDVPVNSLSPGLLVLFTAVDLSNNKFEGEIPNIICSLESLKVLNLSHNNLHGQIPHSIGNLINIESLDLSNNQLVGEIPTSLVSVTCLAILNLSQNHLMGHIPQGNQFSTFDDTSFGGNPGLCGLPLSKLCAVPTQVEDMEGGGFIWKPVMLGYGFGTLLGLVMGYYMLSTGRPKWFNAIADAGVRMVHKRQNKQKPKRKGKRN